MSRTGSTGSTDDVLIRPSSSRHGMVYVMVYHKTISPSVARRLAQELNQAADAAEAQPYNDWAKERVKLRPDNFEQLSAREQWEIDRELGILDWDGKMSKPPKETVELISRPRDRDPTRPKVLAPPKDWNALRQMTVDELKEWGCGLWDETLLMLFPLEWYDVIPEGFEVVTISGARRRFHREPGRDDVCAGFLAYGVIARGR